MLIDRSFAHLVSRDEPRSRDERRAYPRVPVEVDVMIGGGGRVVTCVSGDVSIGGFAVSTYAPSSVGSTVWFRFQLPTGVVVGAGVVRWVREGKPGHLPAMGVEVAKMSAADRECLVRFCLPRCA
jgi:uncharacterized protein (TIGR02266 family)